MKKLYFLLTAVLIAVTMNAQNVLENASIDWDMGNGTGWSVNETVLNGAGSNLTFETVDGTTSVMRVTNAQSAATLQAVITSTNITSIPAGDYNIKLRFRTSVGLESNGGPYETRFFIQDHGVWTNFTNPNTMADGQVFGVFKLGGIPHSNIWTNGAISDTDDNDDFLNTGEWVEVTFDFTIDSELTNKAFKLLVKIGDAHVTASDMYFEYDYINFSSGTSTDISTSVAADNIYVAGKTLYVTGAEATSYKLYNLSGVVVEEGEVAGTSVDLDAPKGLYIIKVGTTTKKVMIK